MAAIRLLLCHLAGMTLFVTTLEARSATRFAAQRPHIAQCPRHFHIPETPWTSSHLSLLALYLLPWSRKVAIPPTCGRQASGEKEEDNAAALRTWRLADEAIAKYQKAFDPDAMFVDGAWMEYREGIGSWLLRQGWRWRCHVRTEN
jgi:hypothetical protein